MLVDKKKRIERFYLERARLLYSGFPQGHVENFENPDFRVLTPEFKLGIELTQLYQPASKGKYPPREVETFRKKVIRRAAEIYVGQSNSPVDVLVFFSSHPTSNQDQDALSKAIAEIVRNKNQNVTFIVDRRKAGCNLPAGVELIRVAPAIAGYSLSWQASAVHETIPLTRELVKDSISKKNVLVSRYRSQVDKVWLLIVIDLFPASCSFSVPKCVESWSLPGEFDKILMYSREDERVWSFQPNQ